MGWDGICCGYGVATALSPSHLDWKIYILKNTLSPCHRLRSAMALYSFPIDNECNNPSTHLPYCQLLTTKCRMIFFCQGWQPSSPQADPPIPSLFSPEAIGRQAFAMVHTIAVWVLFSNKEEINFWSFHTRTLNTCIQVDNLCFWVETPLIPHNRLLPAEEIPCESALTLSCLSLSASSSFRLKVQMCGFSGFLSARSRLSGFPFVMKTCSLRSSLFTTSLTADVFESMERQILIHWRGKYRKALFDENDEHSKCQNANCV